MLEVLVGSVVGLCVVLFAYLLGLYRGLSMAEDATGVAIEVTWR